MLLWTVDRKNRKNLRQVFVPWRELNDIDNMRHTGESFPIN